MFPVLVAMTNWSIHLFMNGDCGGFKSAPHEAGWRLKRSARTDCAATLVRSGCQRPLSRLSSLFSILQPAVEYRCPLVAERLGALPCIGVVVGDGRTQRHVLE